MQRTAQSRNWLEITTDADIFAVGDAAFDASSIVVGAGEGRESGSSAVTDLVVHLRTGTESSGHAGSDLDGFHSLQGHHGGREHAIQAFIPLGVGAETGRDLMCDYLENSAERISSL